MPAARPNRNPPRTRPSCGTISGHTLHSRYNEHPCDACRDARLTWETNLPEAKKNVNRLYQRARQRAHSALKKRHRDEFEALMLTALIEVGYREALEALNTSDDET